jgi:cytochrome c biogenesis protein CcdA
VPILFVEDDYFIGFDGPEGTGQQILKAITKCLEKQQNTTVVCEQADKGTIKLPFGLGELDSSEISLPLFTLIIGGLDGFNPCAMWVLTFLLSLLIYSKSRKKMMLIGGIFVLTSGLIYFVFMTAWFNIFFLSIGKFDLLIRSIIAGIAIVAGLINIKELFWFKKGVSLTISDKHKPKLYKKMREIIHERNVAIAIFSTILLAVFVNFIELLCTTILPASYTNILAAQSLPTLGYYAYLALYNIIYVVPLFVIVTVFVLTMGRHKFTEKQGKLLKLISGLLMLTLGLIMLIRPELLNFV